MDQTLGNNADTHTVQINPGNMLSDVAIGRVPDWQANLDGVDVLFQNSGKTK